MALIEFQDLPNTTTPLNAANLNNNFNACYERAYIMVYLSANTTIVVSTAWANYNIPFDTTKYNVGGKFSLNTTTGQITYTGDKALKITLHVKRDASTTAGRVYAMSPTESFYQENTNDAVETANNISIRPKGSTASIYGRIRANGTGNAVLNGNATSPYTYMLVEEI